jgi:hypothetical protein
MGISGTMTTSHAEADWKKQEYDAILSDPSAG